MFILYINFMVFFFIVRVFKLVEESNYFDLDIELEDEIEEVDEDKIESEEEESVVRNIVRLSRYRGKDIVCRLRCRMYRYI